MLLSSAVRLAVHSCLERVPLDCEPATCERRRARVRRQAAGGALQDFRVGGLVLIYLARLATLLSLPGAAASSLHRQV